jgi:hypothetical protein
LQNVRVHHVGKRGLDFRLVAGVGDEHLLVGQIRLVAAGPGAEHGSDSRFPVDQRSVAIEAEDVVVREVHEGFLAIVLMRSASASPR